MEVEKEHVHKVYSKIAAHFSDTRHKPWPRIAQFLQSQPPGSLIADVGCGNGKYLGVNPQVFVLGSDICPELVAIGCSRGHQVLTCDCLHLPYRSNQFDGVICIAVIHHLSSESRRLDALKEMARVLRPGGKMLVYVWAMEQERKKFDGQDVMVPWHLQPKYSPAEKGAGHKDEVTAAEEKAARARAKKLEKKKRRKAKEKGCAVTAGGPLPGEEKDVGPLPGEEKEVGPLPGEEKEANPIASCDAGGESRQQDVDSCEPVGKQDPSKAKTCDDKTYLVQQGYTTYHRYYHVFREGELTGLFHQLPQLHVQEDFYDHENWCVLAQKQF